MFHVPSIVTTTTKNPVVLMLTASMSASTPFVFSDYALFTGPVVIVIVGLCVWGALRSTDVIANQQDVADIKKQLGALTSVVRAIARKAGVDEKVMKELDRM